MAINDDTFWVEHAPAAAEGPYLPGLRLNKVEDNRRWTRRAGAAAGFVGALFLLLWWQSGWSPVVPSLLAVVGVGGIAASPAMRHGLERFLLLDDNSDTPEFDGEPEKLRILLQKLTASDKLCARLTPPEVSDSAPSAFWTVFPLWDGMRPVAVLVFWGYALGQALLVLDGFAAETGLTAIHGMALANLAILLLFVACVHQRVRGGVQRFGAGDPFADDHAPPARFGDVESAAFRWDSLLGRPYLLLGLGGRRYRYYSPIADPLHLLRVARYRMPHLELQV